MRVICIECEDVAAGMEALRLLLAQMPDGTQVVQVSQVSQVSHAVVAEPAEASPTADKSPAGGRRGRAKNSDAPAGDAAGPPTIRPVKRQPAKRGTPEFHERMSEAARKRQQKKREGEIKAIWGDAPKDARAVVNAAAPGGPRPDRAGAEKKNPRRAPLGGADIWLPENKQAREWLWGSFAIPGYQISGTSVLARAPHIGESRVAQFIADCREAYQSRIAEAKAGSARRSRV